MNIIYSKKHFNLYKVGRNSFIIHNINKEFKYGHTHINNYNTAKWIINLAFHKTMPKRANKYILNSLIRVSKDNAYIRSLENEIKNLKSSHAINLNIKERNDKNGND